jgi:hypothetical protein
MEDRLDSLIFYISQAPQAICEILLQNNGCSVLADIHTVLAAYVGATLHAGHTQTLAHSRSTRRGEFLN